jgi:protein phosphatase
MNIVWAVATHQGRIRTNNEDSVFPTSSGRSDETTVLMVADGMGGHAAGEIASRLAIAAAGREASEPIERVTSANQAIIEHARTDPGLAGMGTTLTLTEFRPEGEFRFAHVGDSRAYLLHGGDLNQLTVDHTVMAEYLRSGSISPEEVATHPQRSMLTRALGLLPEVEVDAFDVPVAPGDRLLLCSDGVSSMLSEEEIRRQLAKPSAEEAAWGLVDEANRAGGHDNITAVVIDVVAAPR